MGSSGTLSPPCFSQMVVGLRAMWRPAVGIFALRPMLLRFKDAEEEARFKESCEDELVVAGSIISSTVCMATISFIFFLYFQESPSRTDPLCGKDSRHFTYAIWMFMAAVAAMYPCLSALRTFCGLFRKYPWEEYFTASAAMFCVSFVCSNRWHGPLLFGEDPEETWSIDPRQSAIHIPLLLDIGLTMVCLYLPVRSSVVWVLPVSSVGVFTALQLSLPTAFDGAHYDVLILVTLAAFALHGSYKNEFHRRERWVAIQKAHLAEAVVEQQHDEIASLRDEIKVTGSEFLDVVVPLPGSVPKADKMAKPMHSPGPGQPLRTKRSTMPPLSPSSSTEEVPSDGDQMDGAWVLTKKCQIPGVSSWLLFLDISGDRVVLGDNSTSYLKARENHKFLEGGRIFVKGGVLYREGKKTTLSYKRRSAIPRSNSEPSWPPRRPSASYLLGDATKEPQCGSSSGGDGRCGDDRQWPEKQRYSSGIHRSAASEGHKANGFDTNLMDSYDCASWRSSDLSYSERSDLSRSSSRASRCPSFDAPNNLSFLPTVLNEEGTPRCFSDPGCEEYAGTLSCASSKITSASCIATLP